MPENFGYGGTITFDPNLSLEEKNKLIEQFPKVLSQHLYYSKTKDTRYYLCVSKEYHKVDLQDDYEAPHLHFILYADRSIPIYRVRSINRVFKETCGRTQFYKMTNLKLQSWSRYITKDSERLYELTGQPHYYEMNLEQCAERIDMMSLEDTSYDVDYYSD